MKRIFAIVIAATATVVWAAAPGTPMNSGMKLGEISIVPQPKLVNGKLILKVVALNESQKAAAFGPEDVTITTAGGKTVPLMSLDALIAQVKADARSGSGSSGSYNSSYAPGPSTTYNQYGQPDVHNFTGNSQPLSGQINSEAPVSTHTDAASAEVLQRIASLKAGILQDVTIAPGGVKGGEIVTQPIRFHWREKRTLRIAVRFNGEQHEFELPAPPEE